MPNSSDILLGPKSWSEAPPQMSPIALLKLQDTVQLCERIIGYTFQNKILCVEALLTYNATVVYQGAKCIVRKNDSLAVHGDAVLDAHLSSLWVKTGRSKGQPGP